MAYFRCMEPELGPSTLPPVPARGRRRALVGTLAVLSLAAGALVGVAPWSKAKSARIASASSPTLATATTLAPPTTVPAAVEVVTSTTATTVAAPPVTAPPVTAPAVPPTPPPTAALRAAGMTFGQRLEHALAGTPGCLVVEQDGAVIFERNPVAALVPASSQKLMVGIAV